MAKKAKKYKTMYEWSLGVGDNMGDLNSNLEDVLKEIAEFGILDEDEAFIYECTPIKRVTSGGLNVEDLA